MSISAQKVKEFFTSAETFKDFLESEEAVRPHPVFPPPSRSANACWLGWNSAKAFGGKCLFYLFDRCVHPYIKNWFPTIDRKISLSLKYSIFEARSASLLSNKNVLWRSLNTHRPGTEIYLQMPDFWLRIREFSKGSYVCGSRINLEPYSKDGLCRGMCDWFALRYFRTLSSFPSPRECILSLAKHFENGAGHVPIIFQGNKGYVAIKAIRHISGLKVNDQCYNGMLTRQSVKNEDKQALENLKPGLYFIGISGKHLITVVRTAEADYIFDPSEACIEHQKDNFASALAQKIEQYVTHFGPTDDPDFEIRSVDDLSPSKIPNTTYTIGLSDGLED